MSAPIDPAFDTPFADYGQVGSFIAPVALPPLGPLDGTLVNLPCINPDWLLLVLGCVDQLRNRSSWLASYTDAQIVAILGAVEELRIALQMANPCCTVALQLTPGCVLQYSTDGGATWTDVAGWAANFSECVKRSQIPGVPLLPPGSSTGQRACNIAGYLANFVVKEAIQQAINGYNTNLSLLNFAANLAAVTFAFDLPWTTAFIYAAYDLYKVITAGTIADFTAAAADTTLWSNVTCAIYNAIKADSQVTRSNYPAMLAAVCGVSYAHPEVVAAICTYLTDLGVDGVLSLQAAGALDTVDCSGCGGTWCYKFDYTAGDQGSQVYPTYDGHFVAGTGWQSGNTVRGYNEIGFYQPLGRVIPLTSFSIWVITSLGSAGRARTLYVQNPFDTTVGSFNVDALAHPPPGAQQAWSPVGLSGDTVAVIYRSGGGAPPDVIQSIELQGTGPNPFGPDNCTY